MSNHEQDNEKRRRTRRRGPDGGGIPTEVVDQLLKNYRHPGDLTGPDGLLKQLTAALVNRAMDGALTHHLGYEAVADAIGDRLVHNAQVIKLKGESVRKTRRGLTKEKGSRR